MIHILTIIGARPQIIKAAALNRAIRTRFADQLRETIVHTGQHYDENMSQVFFDELEIPAADYNLNIGSGTRDEQIAAMNTALSALLQKEKPDALVLYGDTNSTMAGAMVGKALNIPVVHIEAGMRSFNLSMPEEVNRIYCDQVSTLLFSPTKSGYDNLVSEGIHGHVKSDKVSPEHPAIYHCGDVMYDNSLYFAAVAEKKSAILSREKLQPNQYFLATVHRDFNADSPQRLSAIIHAFEAVAMAHNMPVVLPLHPRTRKNLAQLPELEKKIASGEHIRILPPASFLEMILLEKNAKLVLTDSGGVQKEAFFFRKPCVILRPETEWVELVECGAALLADAEPGKIETAVASLLQKEIQFPQLFGDGHAAEFICSEMIYHFS